MNFLEKMKSHYYHNSPLTSQFLHFDWFLNFEILHYGCWKLRIWTSNTAFSQRNCVSKTARIVFFQGLSSLYPFRSSEQTTKSTNNWNSAKSSDSEATNRIDKENGDFTSKIKDFYIKQWCFLCERLNRFGSFFYRKN